MATPWNFQWEAREMAMKLMAGHPGAMGTVCNIMEALPEENTLRVLFTHMAAMRMWGILLFYAYDECGQDLKVFVDRVTSMDTQLVDGVNRRLDQERFAADKRLVHDGYIDWPSELPDPTTVRKMAQLLS
jgi:hypothetical protein